MISRCSRCLLNAECTTKNWGWKHFIVWISASFCLGVLKFLREIQLIDEISTVLAWRKLLLRCSIYRKAHIYISIIDISIIDISTLFKNIDIDKVTFENIDIIAWQKLLLQWTAWEGLNQVNFPTIWSLLFVFGFLYWSSQIQRNIV